MGSCVSRSGAAATSTAAESVSVHALTAKVVDLDGSMAQFAAPVTAHEALSATATAGGGGAAPPSSPPRFLCCSDALDFDAPVTALAAHDALRPGQLYFALPTSMLDRPLSAQDMAALAVKACAALGTAPVVAAADVAAAAGSVPSSSLGRSEASTSRQQRWQATGRVAPLVVIVSADAHGEWKSYPVRGGYKDARKAARGGGGETVGKARNGVGYKGVARDLAPVQRLSVIVEAANE
ncbi:unnamed protein product [Miscanthus lutarioriparius]|uniref:TMV response-related protein n=1 Tax=Miscanthus lutarioriparius TaxID=422564 RepID=A0A811N662_9POAL|nr:unnamed protein product [Miscanthus lutarioriparius]